MPARRNLSERPDIAQLKKQAKELLRSHRAGEAACVPRLRAHVHTRPSWSDDDLLGAKVSLLDAQLVIAREYGFDNWHGLALHVAQRAGQPEPHAAPARATPGTSRTVPDALLLGPVYEGALVDAGFAHLVNAPVSDIDAQVDTPAYIETLSVEPHARQGGQRGESWSAVVCKLRIGTDSVGAHVDRVRIRTSVGATDVPIEFTVLPQAGRRQRVLVVVSPYVAFSHGGPSDLTAFRNVATAADVDIHYAHDLPRDLSEYDVVLLSGGPLISLGRADVHRFCAFVETGGRLVLAANRYMTGSVAAANLLLDRHGMHMEDMEPKSAVDAGEEDKRIALHGVGNINLLRRNDPLTEGIGTLVFHRPSPVRVTDPDQAELLALTPPPFYHGDGFAAVSRDAGEVVALGQSLWASWAGMHEDNARFLLNRLAVPAPKAEGALEGTSARPQLVARLSAREGPAAEAGVVEPLSETGLQGRMREGVRRSATEITRELESLQEPARDASRQSDAIYQSDCREREAAWAYRRTRLIRELYVSHPTEAALVDLLPERWALHHRLDRRHQGPEELDPAYEEMDAVLAADSPRELLEQARFALVDFLTRYQVGRDGDREKWRRGRNAEIRRAMAACLAHHADDRRMPRLLAQQADGHSDDPVASKQLWTDLARRYPDAPQARYVAGKVRQADALHQPFELSFQDALSGEEASTRDYRGKPVLLSFWAPSSPNSKNDHKAMHKVRDGYGADRVACLGICLDTDIDAMRNHCADYGVTWPQWLEGDGRESAFSLSWGIDHLPAQFLIRPDGTLYSTASRNHLDWMIPALLGEPLPVR